MPTKISKGEIVATSQPFVFALLSEERHSRCEQCFRTLSDNVKVTCEDCGYVSYCSEKCRDESFSIGFHRVECRTAAHRPLRNLTRLIARVLLRLYCPIRSNESSGNYHMDEDRSNGPAVDQMTAALDSPTEWIRGYKRDWNCLMDHYDDITHDGSAMHTFEYIYEELELIFDGSPLPRTSSVRPKLTEIISDENLIRIYGKILVNSFAIHESGDKQGESSSLRQIGRGVYLGPSIFDHSCSPDVMFTFDGTRLFLIALRDLPTNDVRNIYISYIDEFETFHERQRQLRNAFYFDCACQRCCKDSQSTCTSLSVEENVKLRPLNDKIEDLYSCTRFEFRYGQIAQRKLHLLSSISKISPDFNTNFIDPVECQLTSSIIELIDKFNLEAELNRLESIQAIRIADFVACHRANPRLLERLSTIYRKYYGDFHPRLLYKLYHFIGILLVKISQIYQARKARFDSPNQLMNKLEDTQLQTCFHVISRLFRQTKVIQQFVDDTIEHAYQAIDKMNQTLSDNNDQNVQNKSQQRYSTRVPSYRDLLQESDTVADKPCNDSDTRKR